MMGATLFSGIGAPEVAMPDWCWPWHAEIDKFPSTVMAAQHPQSVNLGDVTANDFTLRARSIATPDVLVFGSPCQDFSIAGRRAGMDGKRGNLSMVALGILGQLRPRWFVFENVPGLLSIDKGHGFQWFLRRVDELGYFGAWASLDAQYFGVAQRRKRVFFVGHIGDWRGPAAVLLEPQSLCWNHPPRRQTREGTAPTLSARTKGGGGLGTDFDCDGGLIANALRASSSPNGHGHSSGLRGDGADNLVAFNNTGQGWWNQDGVAAGIRDASAGGASHATIVAHALRADGFDASEDGTGRGTPLIAFEPRNRGDDGRGYDRPPNFMEDCSPSLNTVKTPAIAFDCKAGGNTGFSVGDIPGALRGEGFGGGHSAIATSSVRRLTPRECERLQGFPDDYTAITYRNKPAADGPRYKALGNSMAVPVVRWILSRIDTVDEMFGRFV